MLNTSDLPNQAPDFDLQELFEAGMHFGHRSHKWHPKMKPWIYMEKNGVHIFDLAKTADQLTIAYNFLFKLGSENKAVVMVGTKTQARKVVEVQASEAGMNYVSTRWLGGLFTNWPQVKKSLKKMIEIEQKLNDGAYKGYTKYEIVQVEKELARLRRFFEGLRSLKDLPSCVIVIDAQREHIAITESEQVKVPVIAMVDSNTDPEGISIPVPANDDAAKSIEYFIKVMTEAYKAGRESAPTKPTESATPALPASTVKAKPVAQVKVEADVVKTVGVKDKTPATKKSSEVAKPAVAIKLAIPDKPAKKAVAKQKKVTTQKVAK